MAPRCGRGIVREQLLRYFSHEYREEDSLKSVHRSPRSHFVHVFSKSEWRSYGLVFRINLV